MFHLKANQFVVLVKEKSLNSKPIETVKLTSGVHFSGIFSNESGESTEKHMRITSVSG